MKTLLVFAHPLKEGSFNHALKDITESMLRELRVSDLYQMHFKAVADWSDFEGEHYADQYTAAQKEAFLENGLIDDIEKEQEKLKWADHIIFQFPLWWFSCPAILKGYFDRVISKGFAYDKGAWFETGLLKGKSARLVTTTQSVEASYQKGDVHGPIEAYLKPIHHTLKLAGIEIQRPFVAYGVDGGSDELRAGYLQSYTQEMKKHASS